MKKYTIHLAGLLALLFSVSQLSAQDKKLGLMLGANGLYSNPKGNFGNNYSRGLGGGIQGGIGIGKTFLVASTGYANYFGKSGVSDLSVKPVTIGLRQYLLGKRLFVNAHIGRATIKEKNHEQSRVQNLRGVGVGARLLGLEASVNYEGWDNTGINGFSNSLQYKLGWSFIL